MSFMSSDMLPPLFVKSRSTAWFFGLCGLLGVEKPFKEVELQVSSQDNDEAEHSRPSADIV